MVRFGLLVLAALLASFSAAQQSFILQGSLIAPDGTPVRNLDGTLQLKLKGFDDRYLSHSISFSIRTDERGVYRPQVRDWLDKENLRNLERDKGKRALTWVYIYVPKVGALITRRFLWTIGEPLPPLQLKPPARLTVKFVRLLLNTEVERKGASVRLPDDHESLWWIEEKDWLPANEWLTVAGISVRLNPYEERQLVVPVMPADKVPVRIRFFNPAFKPSESPLHLPIRGNLLVNQGNSWSGLAEVDRTDPYQFVFVPPLHLLRLPVERLPMRPVVDTIHELDHNLQPYPITQVEVEVVDEKGNPLRHLLDVLRLNRAAQDKLWDALADARFYGREQILPKELAETLWKQLMGGDYRAERKFMLIPGIPVLLRVYYGEWNRSGFVAVPLKTSGMERLKLRFQLNLPQQERPQVLRIKTGRLEGVARTLDGKPVAQRTIIALFAERELVDWLSEDDNSAFYAQTDEQGRFVFEKLPEGKYDIFVENFEWTGCVEAVVKAGETTKVTLLGYFVRQEEPKERTITLRLLFPDGKPYFGCDVSVMSQFQSGGRTDEHGCVNLKVRGEWLEIRASDYSWRLPAIRIAPDQTEITVTVPITLFGQVEGRVLLPDGKTSDSVLVTAWRLSEEGRFGYKGPEKIAKLRVLPDGRFFCTLPEGVYVFKAEPMLRDYGSPNTGASLSPPVFVKAGEVTRVEWKLKPRISCSLNLALPLWFTQLPQLGTLFIRQERGEHVYESRCELPSRVAIAKPLGELGDEDMIWDGSVEAPQGFYRFTSWGWEGEQFNGVVQVSENVDRLAISPPSALPVLTLTGQVLLPNGKPANYAVVTLHDPDQSMRRWATVCDENGHFRLKVRIPSKSTLEMQHLDTLLPNSRHQLWLIAWKPGYGHSPIRLLSRPEGNLTLDVGKLRLSSEQKLEGRVVDEKGEPIGFASIVMLPLDPSLFEPSPKEPLWQELTAFEDRSVSSMPHAQADAEGRFRVSGLREGRYLLVASVLYRGEWRPRVTYQLVTIPSSQLTIKIPEPAETFEGSPKSVSEALPLAEVVVNLPCWRSYRTFRTDAAGRFLVEGLPRYEGVPMLVKLLHRDGIAVSFNPPHFWNYQIALRP